MHVPPLPQLTTGLRDGPPCMGNGKPPVLTKGIACRRRLVACASSDVKIACELGRHKSDRTVAAHRCDSVIGDVVCDAVVDPATGTGGRLDTVALEIGVPIGDDKPSRLGVEHVVVQGNNVVTNRSRAAQLLPSVSRRPVTSAV